MDQDEYIRHIMAQQQYHAGLSGGYSQQFGQPQPPPVYPPGWIHSGPQQPVPPKPLTFYEELQVETDKWLRRYD